MSSYLPSIVKQLRFYKHLGSKTIDLLPDSALFHQANPECNSIAILVKHLHGNMMSRWTEFLTTDGEKPWRNRDGEFVNDLTSRDEVTRLWREGFDIALRTLDILVEQDLEKVVYIRNQGHTVIEAINRQLAHIAYHVGQIVYIGKLLTGAKWQSLSIPRNKSEEYNKDKFSKTPGRAHFSDEFLSDE